MNTITAMLGFDIWLGVPLFSRCSVHVPSVGQLQLQSTSPLVSFPVGLSLLCSNIVLLFYPGILPCYCYYSHASLVIMFILCSFDNWENTSNLKRDKLPSNWHPSLPALHHHCCHWRSECYCPDAGCHFSEFSPFTLPNLFAAMWQLAHAPCYYSGTMLKCFWLTIILSTQA